MAGWVKAVLFLLGGLGAAAGTAYVTGMLDPWLAPKPAEISSLVDAPPTAADEKAPQKAPETADKPADAAPAEATEDETAADPVTTPKTDRVVPPVFDLLRVEADGSVLVAGKAVPNALVEVLSGDAVLGKSAAGTGGDFVVVLDRLLPPGDYRLTLRATSPEGEAALSDGTAIVSVPEAKDGQVLAMVEAPGQPAQLITVPQAEAAPAEEPAEAQAGAPAEADEQPEVAQAEPEQAQAAPEAEVEAEADATQAAEAEAKPAEDAAPGTQAAPQPAAIPSVSVEAVEIEGDTIFVAGRADPGRTVRVYAGSVLLGDAVASEGGRFLIEARRHLDVGNYLIRADLLGDDGAVVARAGVPFEREPGETIAAVAPAAPQPQPEKQPEQQPQQPAVAEAAGDDKEAAARPDAATNEAAGEAASEAAEEVATAPALQRVDGAVIIRRGDSLWRISRRVYGHGIRYSTIYLANQDQIRDPDRIWPGQVFSVPDETPEGEKADLGAVGDQAVKPEDRDAAGK